MIAIIQIMRDGGEEGSATDLHVDIDRSHVLSETTEDADTFVRIIYEGEEQEIGDAVIILRGQGYDVSVRLFSYEREL